MALPQDALWYKDAVIYQVHVRTFFDTNADGIGDFRRARRRGHTFRSSLPEWRPTPGGS